MMPREAVPRDRLPSLDGWRALSILLVLGGHCVHTAGFPPRLGTWAPALFDGYLGVRIFFVISGFLITWLLLAEHKRNGRVSLKRFYLRRALRILPVCFAYLGVVALLQAFGGFHQGWREWAANLTFFSNFDDALPWTTGHLWSLAIEEQFYLIWPLAFVALGSCGALKPTARVLMVPIAVAPVVRVFVYKGWIPSALGWAFSYYASLSHFDSLAIGCLAAVVAVQRPAAIERVLVQRPLPVSLSALLAILLPALLIREHTGGILSIPLGETLQGAGVAVLILQSITLCHSGPFRILNTAPARVLGVLSYSLYLWQQLFCSNPRELGLATGWYFSFPTWIVAALAASATSYFLLEKPLLSLRKRLRV